LSVADGSQHISRIDQSRQPGLIDVPGTLYAPGTLPVRLSSGWLRRRCSRGGQELGSLMIWSKILERDIAEARHVAVIRAVEPCSQPALPQGNLWRRVITV